MSELIIYCAIGALDTHIAMAPSKSITPSPALAIASRSSRRSIITPWQIQDVRQIGRQVCEGRQLGGQIAGHRLSQVGKLL